MHESTEFVVVENWALNHDLSTRGRLRIEKVPLGTQRAADCGDKFLSDCIKRRVCHLREKLSEVIEQETRARRKDSDWRIGSHRTNRLKTVLRHWLKNELHLFVGVTEELLTLYHCIMRHQRVRLRCKRMKFDLICSEPIAIGMTFGKIGFDLFVVDNSTLLGIDKEHPTRSQAALLHHACWVDVDNANFGRHDHEIISGHPITRRPETVAVEKRANHGAIGKCNGGWPIPWLHE